MSAHSALFGLYRPTGSFLERMGVGPAYALGLGLSVPALIVQRWWVTAACLVIVVGLLLGARLGRRALILPRVFWLLVAVLAAYHVILGNGLAGFVLGANLVLAVLATRLVTMTTPGPVLLDALVTAAAPLKLVGLSPERFGLAVAVMLRSIPFLIGSFGDVQDAARARGLERNVLARVTPVVVRAVAYAHATGDALAARGLGDDEP